VKHKESERGSALYKKAAAPHKKVVPPVIGYEYLLSRIPLRMPPLDRPARVRSGAHSPVRVQYHIGAKAPV